MARDGGGAPAVEPRRVALRALFAGGDAATRPVAEEATRTPSKGLLRGLRCTSAAAAQAFEPDAAVRPSADWRGLGCASVAASQVHAPAAAVDASRSSSADDWRGRRRRRRGEERRRRGLQAERSHRERPGAAPAARRVTMREHMSASPTHSPPHHHGMPLTDADTVPPARNRHLGGRRHSRVRVEEEMMMFRTRVLLERMGFHDQYQDWRLDVDNMTYEELLDLEDRIGYVSTGLCEDEIVRSLRMVKHTPFNTRHFSTEMDRRCSICQEEFEASEEIGKLSCGHNYHVHCIKQWLSRKNSCPVCKTAISKT